MGDPNRGVVGVPTGVESVELSVDLDSIGRIIRGEGRFLRTIRGGGDGKSDRSTSLFINWLLARMDSIRRGDSVG